MAMPEPECVQWKRKGQRTLQKKLAGMTRAEVRAFWRASYQKMLVEQDESKRRMQEAQTKSGAPAKREVTPMPEPECVQWKRKGQRTIRERLAGMTVEEEAAYWDKAHRKLMRTHAESKRRLQAKASR